MNTDEPLPTRASLLNRLKDADDHRSWEEFHRMYRGLLVGTARRAGLNEHETEEAVQDTLITVAKKMPEFRYEAGRDSFKGWLLRIVRWKISDQFRKRKTPRPASDRPFPFYERGLGGDSVNDVAMGGWEHLASPTHDSPDPAAGLDAIWNAEWERHLMRQALDVIKRRARPDQYAIFHLHVIEERPLAEVRRTLGVSAAAVYLAKHRVGRLLKKELRRLHETER